MIHFIGGLFAGIGLTIAGVLFFLYVVSRAHEAGPPSAIQPPFRKPKRKPIALDDEQRFEKEMEEKSGKPT
jgi:hypothetical protein